MSLCLLIASYNHGLAARWLSRHVLFRVAIKCLVYGTDEIPKALSSWVLMIVMVCFFSVLAGSINWIWFIVHPCKEMWSWTLVNIDTGNSLSPEQQHQAMAWFNAPVANQTPWANVYVIFEYINQQLSDICREIESENAVGKQNIGDCVEALMCSKDWNSLK